MININLKDFNMGNGYKVVWLHRDPESEICTVIAEQKGKFSRFEIGIDKRIIIL